MEENHKALKGRHNRTCGVAPSGLLRNMILNTQGDTSFALGWHVTSFQGEHCKGASPRMPYGEVTIKK